MLGSSRGGRAAPIVKGECFSGAFLLMQEQFLETIFRNEFFILLSSLFQVCLQVFLLPFSNHSTAPELLQGLGGSGLGCKSPSSITVAIQSSLTCRC